MIDRTFPTRLIPSGLIDIAAGASLLFDGKNATQKRIQFVITNLDAAQHLLLRTGEPGAGEGRTFAVVFPERSFTLETSAPIIVHNSNGAGTVRFCVAELFPDTDARP